MNVVKSYAWEDSFLDRIMNVRRSELEWIKKNSLLNGFNAFVIGAVPVLVTVATFAVYISMGNNLTAATAFTSISLFNVLRMPLIMLPQVITQWTTAQVHNLIHSRPIFSLEIGTIFVALQVTHFLCISILPGPCTITVQAALDIWIFSHTSFSWHA
jgi:hypothetical protein